MASAGLNAAVTRRTVERSSESPSSAKYSHWSGTMTPWEATSPFSVSRPREGGQSMRMCS